MSNRMQAHPYGEIYKWPGGFAASIAGASGLERCCEGHPTPQQAAAHGVARVRELLERRVVLWRGRA